MKSEFLLADGTLYRQKAFDHIVKSIFEQGGPSVELGSNDAQFCVYKNPEDRRCSAGHLMLPDECNNPVNVQMHPAFKQLSSDDKDFVFSVQHCHDAAAQNYGEADFMAPWLDGMKSVATQYNLQFKDPRV